MQYALVIAGAIRGSLPEIRTRASTSQILNKKLVFFYKVFSNKVLKYIYEAAPPLRDSFRNPNTFTAFPCRAEYFKNSLFSMS